ncbi:DsbE family thiol:disulfide interchange protein [Hoeflea sp. WL0058]|uniref:DsbE family thiol:disulfide interchange protein n=1 Tax=Flavimaribacter sediminis TaxID=2865987 RepID=A0AAE2ZKK3_9HYPH|nr:DsbE family thiol:disulfide interchange protein [Flavimaribacter sediminis]MBW8638539.1 DsbE family thiol:disulfide interchange protein [Flavimaribacter sediminis]
MAAETENDSNPAGRRMPFIAFLPVVIFAILAIVFFGVLTSGRDVSEIPSALIGQQAPSLDLPPLEGLTRDGAPVPALTDEIVDGQLTLVNVWASWCVPCRQEHPLLMELANDDRIRVVGVNYKDKNANALRFLGELGNPYAAVGVDPNGAAAIDWGVYGIPESFLVAPNGEIVFKQVGPFSPTSIARDLMPAVEKALAGS